MVEYAEVGAGGFAFDSTDGIQCQGLSQTGERPVQPVAGLCQRRMGAFPCRPPQHGAAVDDFADAKCPRKPGAGFMIVRLPVLRAPKQDIAGYRTVHGCQKAAVFGQPCDGDAVFGTMFQQEGAAPHDSFLQVGGAQRQQQNKALRDSLKQALQLLSFHPDSVDLLLKKASWNVCLEGWAYAKDTYDKVLFLEPSNVAALYYRAYVNERMGRYNFARLDYEHLLYIVPGHFECQLGLALLNQRDRHYTKALDQINSLIHQYPDSALAYAARAGMEKERGMLELAVFDFTEPLQRAPHNIDYRLNRIDLFLTLGRKREAEEDLLFLVRKGVPRASLRDFYRRLKE